jgi:DNA repair protein RadD
VFNLHVSGHPSYFANGILVHNCHLIPEDGEGMYRKFLTDMKVVNPRVRVLGMTATPFRMKSGTICAPENILNAVCFEIGVRELIVQGYLCPLRTKAGTLKPDTEKLHVRGGEYIAGEVEDLMDDDNLVLSACHEIIEYTQDRKAILIFASGVRHGQHICRVFAERHKVECGFVCGETLPFERDEALRRFRAGELKYLCNVNVLTTGFDATNIDCVALVRPTLSPGLYYQMVGRGFRLHPGKTDCLVLDFGGNVLRHGPVDAICIADAASNGNGDAPAKECPQCHELIAAGYATCPGCGYEFPPPERTKHEATASSEGILSDQTTRTEHEVTEAFYSVHVKRGAPPDAPRTMRVDYRIAFNEYVSEWVCFEHEGFPRQKAVQWWARRSNEPVPASADEGVELAKAGALAPTLAITVERRAGEKFDRVVGYRLGGKPPRLDSEEQLPEYVSAQDDSVPF